MLLRMNGDLPLLNTQLVLSRLFLRRPACDPDSDNEDDDADNTEFAELVSSQQT